MKLNNKGFVVTSVLYSLLVLFLFVVITFMSVLRTTRNMQEKNNDSITESITMNNKIDINQTFTTSGNTYITPHTGRYTIICGGRIATVYLPAKTTLTLVQESGIGKIKVNNSSYNIDFMNETVTSYKPHIFNVIGEDSTVGRTAMKIVDVYTKK